MPPQWSFSVSGRVSTDIGTRAIQAMEQPMRRVHSETLFQVALEGPTGGESPASGTEGGGGLHKGWSEQEAPRGARKSPHET